MKAPTLPAARVAPLGALGWLLVLASTSAPWWAEWAAPGAVPLALLGTGLAAQQAYTAGGQR